MNKNDIETESTNTVPIKDDYSHRRRSNRDLVDKIVHWLDKNRVSFIWIITSFVMGIVFIALTIFTVLTVSSNANKTNELIAENFNLETKVKEYNNKIFVENDKYLSAMLLRLLPEDQLVSLTKNNWLYKITINGEPVKGREFDIYSPNLEIVFSETELESDNTFPKEINAKGSIASGENNVSYNDYISVTATTSKSTIESKIEGNIKSTTYKFTNLNVGEITYVLLDADLATRLGLPDRDISIYFTQNRGGN